MAKNDGVWKLVCFSITGFVIFLHFAHPRVVTICDDDTKRTIIAENKQRILSSETTTTTFITLKEGVHYTVDYNLTDLAPPLFNPTLPHQFEYVPHDPRKNALLSHRPRIMYFPNFLSAAECDAIIALAKTRMGRSEVALYKEHRDDEKSVQDVRTSTQAWLDPSQVPLVASIQARLRQLLGIHDMELLQVLHYGIGQKYDAHNDYFDPAFYGAQSSNRAATAYMYLNTVEEGGETWFPRANGRNQDTRDFTSCHGGLKVKPVKGGLAVFYDMKPTGELDPDSLHGACPVIRGEKWGGTQWLRTKGI
eukprot:PhF_6_TR25345/c0_g1_i3/m.35066/K00472/P4HA; prolyl 4-hydroxylase